MKQNNKVITAIIERDLRSGQVLYDLIEKPRYTRAQLVGIKIKNIIWKIKRIYKCIKNGCDCEN